MISHRGIFRYGVFYSLKQGDIWDLTFGLWVWNWDHDGLEELRATFKEKKCLLLKNQCSYWQCVLNYTPF